eukprot:scaffold6724_cov62-Phaeocystis_antarctica.AAC.5
MPAVVVDVIMCHHSYQIGMPCASMVHASTRARTAAVQAPEGSFMSPALGGALVLTGMLLRTSGAREVGPFYPSPVVEKLRSTAAARQRSLWVPH